VSEPSYPYVHVDVAADDVESASDVLFELGATGIEERDNTTTMLRAGVGEGLVTLVANFEDDATANEAVAAIDPTWNPRVEHVVGDAWREGWREFFKPSRVGQRLVVRPPWEEFDAKAGDVVLTLDPGLAFGTGTHETTRLVLAQIDARVLPGQRVLDVGCGSGILAIAAAMLGARELIAIDVDDDSVNATNENAQKNGVAEHIQASRLPVAHVTERFPLVLANIEARVLIPMAPDLIARVAEGGTLVLSGVLRDQADQVRAAYAPLTLLEQPAEGEWVALVLRA
jgi:ribosomal protein L11 methyltransferase